VVAPGYPHHATQRGNRGQKTVFSARDRGSPWEIDQGRAHNDVNEIDTDNAHGDGDDATTGSPNWADPNYDAAGNMTEGPAPGSETDGSKRQFYTYDAWNRLVKVVEDTNENGTEEGTDKVLAEYRYDGLHRRIAKLIPDATKWDRTDYYHTVSWQVIEERFAPDQEDQDTVATDPKYQYVWDIRYIDAAVLRDEDTDTDGDCDDERLYYAHDAQFNVTALVNTDGTIAERYVYDPYGKVTIYNPTWSATVDWADSKQNEILYCGYRYDHESRLYHVRFRMYHPTLGRWVQRDPIGTPYAAPLALSARPSTTRNLSSPPFTRPDPEHVVVKAATRMVPVAPLPGGKRMHGRAPSTSTGLSLTSPWVDGVRTGNMLGLLGENTQDDSSSPPWLDSIGGGDRLGQSYAIAPPQDVVRAGKVYEWRRLFARPRRRSKVTGDSSRQAVPKQCGDGMNLYAYARGNPVAYADPSGLIANPPPYQRATAWYSCWSSAGSTTLCFGWCTCSGCPAFTPTQGAFAAIVKSAATGACPGVCTTQKRNPANSIMMGVRVQVIVRSTYGPGIECSCL